MDILLSACALGAGLYFVITEYVRLPSIEARKVITTTKLTQEQTWLEKLLEPLTRYIEKNFPWNEYKMEKLNQTLKTVGMPNDARRYCAEALSQALSLGVLAVPLLFIFPLLSAAPIGLAIFAYHRDMKTPEKQLKEKREKIEAELPKFASTISNSLHTNRDVVKILSSYRKVCGDELRQELDITLADMKSGNSENALRNFEGRIGSPKLSELVRGLLSVLRGEDQVLYFQMKNAELRKEYIERQKREILLRPGKLKGATIATVVLMIVIFLYIFVTQIMTTYTKLF